MSITTYENKPAQFTIEIKYYLHTSTWELEISEHANGCKVFIDKLIIGLEDHKRICRICEIPWGYYKKCLNHPSVLEANVNYWLNSYMGGVGLRKVKSFSTGIEGGVISFELKKDK